MSTDDGFLPELHLQLHGRLMLEHPWQWPLPAECGTKGRDLPTALFATIYLFTHRTAACNNHQAFVSISKNSRVTISDSLDNPTPVWLLYLAWQRKNNWKGEKKRALVWVNWQSVNLAGKWTNCGSSHSLDLIDTKGNKAPNIVKFKDFWSEEDTKNGIMHLWEKRDKRTKMQCMRI